MDFEQLKRGWQEQQAPEALNVKLVSEGLLHRIGKVRKQYIRQNIQLSVMLTLVVVATCLIWRRYAAEFSWAFDVSIVLLNILVALTIAINWYKTTGWHRHDFAANTHDFLAHLISRLKFTKWLSHRGSLGYSVLLWLIILLYIWEVGQALSTTTFLAVVLATSIWIVFGYWWGLKRQAKKDAQATDPLLKELEQLQLKLGQ